MDIVSAAVSVDVKLNKKELKFLELRKKLKQHFREELKKESGSVLDSSEEKKKLPYDNYGSFFGQSQPSIAPRVIIESEGMLEVQQSATLRLKNSTPSKSKHSLLVPRTEVDKLKALRDYSSILSDDAKNLTSLSVTIGKANLKHPSSDMQRALSSSITKKHLDERDEAPDQHKISVSKLHSVTNRSMEQNRKFRQACNAEVVPKLVKYTTKYQIPDDHKVQAYDVHNKASLSKPQSVTKRQPEQDCHKPKAANVMPSKLQSCSQQHKLHNETTFMPKSESQTKQLRRQGKELHKSGNRFLQIKRPVHKPRYDDDQVDMSYISSLCQNLFRRNHSKQVNDDYDFNDDCQVSSFSDILKEERKSAKIARKEDRTELLRIESEEREEKLRRKAKKQKL